MAVGRMATFAWARHEWAAAADESLGEHAWAAAADDNPNTEPSARGSSTRAATVCRYTDCKGGLATVTA